MREEKADKSALEEEGNATKGVEEPNEMESSGDGSKQRYRLFDRVLAILFFALSSSLIVYVNKAVLFMYGFPCKFTLLLAQQTFTIILVFFFNHLGYIKLPKLTPELFYKVMPLTIAFTCDVLLGMFALAVVNIPMYTALRRQSTLLTLTLECFVLKNVPSRPEVRAVLVSMMGALLAGAGDMTFHAFGYFYGLMSCVTTASYRVLIKKLHLGNLNCFTLMLLNSMMAWPVIALCVWLFEQPTQFVFWEDNNFRLMFFLSSCAAFLLNFSMFRCTTLNSPLVTGMTGQAKNVVVALAGFFVFGDVVFHWLNITGHCVCIVGSVMYFSSKLQGWKK